MDKLLELTGDVVTFVAIMLMCAAGFVVMIFQYFWAWGMIAQLVLLGLVCWVSFYILRAGLNGSDTAAKWCLASIVVFSLFAVHAGGDSPCHDGLTNTGVVYLICVGEEAGIAVEKTIEA